MPSLRLVSTDPNHVKNEILREKSILSKYPELTQHIWLATLGVSIQTLDYVNDTCFQATYFIKNTLDLLGMVDVIGYYQLSDISEEYYDAPRILYGASGIISRNGLKKPGFSAVKRLKMAGHKLLAADEDHLITTNGADTYHVVLVNYVYYNEIYCVSGGKGIKLDRIYDSFNDADTKMVDLVIKGLKQGMYKLTCESLSREHGSLFDEWLRYGILDDLQLRDIQYLRDIVHPLRTAQYVECEEGSISINTKVEPHEIKFYEIYRMI